MGARGRCSRHLGSSHLLLHRLGFELRPEAFGLLDDKSVHFTVEFPKISEVIKSSRDGLEGVVRAFQGVLKLEGLGLVEVDLLGSRVCVGGGKLAISVKDHVRCHLSLPSAP